MARNLLEGSASALYLPIVRSRETRRLHRKKYKNHQKIEKNTKIEKLNGKNGGQSNRGLIRTVPGQKERDERAGESGNNAEKVTTASASPAQSGGGGEFGKEEQS